MTTYDYRLVFLDPDVRWGCIEKTPGVNGGDWKLHEGLPLAADLPSDTVWSIAEDSGNLIGDFVQNLGAKLVLSDRARALFEAEGLASPTVEYLPFVLKNKRGRVIEGAKYCLANLLLRIDCLDRQRAKFQATSKGKVAVIDELQLDATKIPPDVKAFRLGEMTRFILLRSDLVERIQTIGLTGLRTRALGEDLTEW